MRSLEYQHAEAAVTSALDAADNLDVHVCAAVVDAGGHLLAFRRQDGSSRVSINMAINKAFTAAMLEMATADLGPLTQPAAPLFGLETAERGRIVSFGGGVPVFVDGSSLGAVGVSGGTVEQDVRIAEAGAEAAAALG